MKIYPTKEIRNITLIGSTGSGKTTLAESMLLKAGIINRSGDITSKSTQSDYNLIEQEYGNSVFSSIFSIPWNERKINVIDTPGTDDLRGTSISSLHVTGSAVLLINATRGVDSGTENNANYTAFVKKPLILLINQLDHEELDYLKLVEQLKILFGNKVTTIQYPVDTGPGFNKIVDVLTMKYYIYTPDSALPEILPIPESEKDKAGKLHNELVEMAAENDENLMELYFEKGTLTEDEMRQGIKLGMLERSLFPVFCSDAKNHIGTTRLMEFITNITPSPAEAAEIPEKNGKTVKLSSNAAPSLFVFKSAIETHIGEITYFKVMSGTIREGIDLINSSTLNKERISQLFISNGKNRTKVSELRAGDIGATVKLKETKINQTLCEKAFDYSFTPIQFPNYRHTVAIKAENEAEDEKVAEVLHKLHDQDPSINFEYSKELKQMLIHCQGEYHLNILKWYLSNQYKIPVLITNPKIPYRETITRAAKASYRHKKQSGGAGQFGEVHLIIEPYVEGKPEKNNFVFDGVNQKLNIRDTQEISLAWGGKLFFHNCIVGGTIDGRYMPAILKGVLEKTESGPLTGSYARDIRVYVYDGKMHPVDSNEISFKLAGRNAFSEAFKNASPKILEPIYQLEITMPSDKLGDVMSDLQTRRATINNMRSEHGNEKITALVPQKELYQYVTSLHSITQGRGNFSMTFSNYEKVPEDIQRQLLTDYELSLSHE